MMSASTRAAAAASTSQANRTISDQSQLLHSRTTFLEHVSVRKLATQPSIEQAAHVDASQKKSTK